MSPLGLSLPLDYLWPHKDGAIGANFPKGWTWRRKFTSQGQGKEKLRFKQLYAFKTHRPCSWVLLPAHCHSTLSPFLQTNSPQNTWTWLIVPPITVCVYENFTHIFNFFKYLLIYEGESRRRGRERILKQTPHRVLNPTGGPISGRWDCDTSQNEESAISLTEPLRNPWHIYIYIYIFNETNHIIEIVILLLLLILSCMSSLYIWDINALSDTWFANISSHLVGCLFILVVVSFAIQKFFSLM